MAEPAQRGDGLGAAILRGAAWVVALRFLLRTLGLISTLILARLLTPADFGIVALATVIVGGIEMLGQFNFRVWLIRQPDPTPGHYDTVWTLGLIRNLCVALLIVLLAEPAGHFYGNPSLIAVLYVLAATTVLAGFENIGLVQFQKEMKFDREFLFFGLVKFGAFLVTIAVAFWWRSYWALLAGMAAGTVLRVCLSYRFLDHRPKISFTGCGAILHFSKWLLIGGLFGFLYTRSRVLILGKMVDSQSLGLFNLAQEISNLAATEMLVPLRRVLLPAYAKLTDDPVGLNRLFLHTFAMILLLGLPIALGIGLVAEPLVRLALGEQWLASVPLIQVLVIYGAASICIANQGPLLMALGHTRALSNLYMLGVVLQVPALIGAVSQFGLVGAVYALAGVHLLLLFVGLSVTLRCAGLSFYKLLASVWRILVAVLIMGLLVHWYQNHILGINSGAFLSLVSSIALGALAYSMAIFLMWLPGADSASAEGSVIRFIRDSLGDRNLSGDRLRRLLVPHASN